MSDIIIQFGRFQDFFKPVISRIPISLSVLHIPFSQLSRTRSSFQEKKRKEKKRKEKKRKEKKEKKRKEKKRKEKKRKEKKRKGKGRKIKER